MREQRTGGAAVALALVLSVIAAFAIGAGVNTAWARRTLLDTNGFLGHVSQPLLADPDAKDALARELTNQTLGNLDLGGGLTEVVPFPLRAVADQLGDQVIADLKEQLQPAIRRQLDSDLVAQTWDRASRELHDQLLDELASGSTASTINVDLHDVLVRALHEIGGKVQQNYSGLPFVTEVFDGIGEVLPPSVGVVPIDVSQIQGPAREAIAHAAGIELVAFVTGAVALGLGLLVSRRRGLTVLVFGVSLIGMAAIGYGLFAFAFHDAGATVAAQSPSKVSADVQQIIDIQAELIVQSYQPWALGLAGAGIAFAAVGAVWAAARRSASSEDPDGWVSPVPGAVPAPAPAGAGWEMPSAPPVR